MSKNQLKSREPTSMAYRIGAQLRDGQFNRVGQLGESPMLLHSHAGAVAGFGDGAERVEDGGVPADAGGGGVELKWLKSSYSEASGNNCARWPRTDIASSSATPRT
ncbi:hypothetical protein ACFQ7F_22855 [Streptomyces sp. NPDC056486]|uniref:hypothetical protein n=1 Tax=Streptomyces sp. NPDC056486 TaxID=3345835 RepID=UPI0036B9340A